MDKVKVIVGKEWSEVFKNRLVLFSVAFLPLIFVAMPFITLASTSGLEGAEAEMAGSEFSGELPGQALADLCEGLSEYDCLQIYMLDLFTLMFMILPVMIPVTIAAYSIVGEKTSRSLEPLLATPITTRELVLSKILAAMIPAVLATWLGYLIYVVGARFLTTETVFNRLLEPVWLLAVIVLGPLLSVLSVSTAIMVSSRVTDPRVAEQLSAVVIVPIILFIVGQSVGLLVVEQSLVLVSVVVVAVLDAGLLYLAVRTFERENILTRWK